VRNIPSRGRPEEGETKKSTYTRLPNYEHHIY
jgi:hypothetical protein